MARKPGKSESLTIRLDPKTRFMLEFVARLRGQTITTVVERAISAAADAAKVPQYNQYGNADSENTWRDYWDVLEGITVLNIARDSELHPTYEEERYLAFAKKHAAFFFAIPDKEQGYKPHYIEILWPRIDEFVALDDSTRGTDYFAAGKAMAEAIRAAGVKAPEWPPVEKPKAAASSKAPSFDDSDIPF